MSHSIKKTISFVLQHKWTILTSFLLGIVFTWSVLRPILSREKNGGFPSELQFQEELQAALTSVVVPESQKVDADFSFVPPERIRAFYRLNGLAFVLVGRDLTSSSTIPAGVYVKGGLGGWEPVLDLPAVFKTNKLVDDGHLEPIALVGGSDGELYLDVSNGLGAGSGEGSLTRFHLGLTGDGLPIVAEPVGCWYYTPETYSPELTRMYPTDTCFTTTIESPWPERMDTKPPMQGEFAYRMLNVLSRGMYEEVAPYISDEMYSVIYGWNDDAWELTRAELLKRGCEVNGLVCGEVVHFQEATTVPEGGEGATWFDVEIVSPTDAWDMIDFQIGVTSDPYTGRYLLRGLLPYVE